jgi:plasmid stabilization system protein ParE
MKLKILESAIEDLHRGREFYARHGAGVGEYFLDSLFSDIDSLVLYAGIHQKVFGYHRLLAKRFPYAVYYLIEDDVAVVYRVLDLRRNPALLRDSLSSSVQTDQE